MISNKKILLSTLSAMFLTATSSFGLEEWTGVKTFAQFEFDKVTPIVVEMNKLHRTVSITEGDTAGHGTYVIKDNLMEIELVTPIETVGYPTVLNPYSGNIEQIQTVMKLNSFSFKEVNEGFFEVIAKGESCRSYYVPGEESKEECIAINDDYNNGVFKDMASRSPLTFFGVGSKVALPVDTMNTAFVEILEDDSVANISQYTDKRLIVKSIKHRFSTIEVEMENGDSISYSKLAQRNGSELLLGVVRDENRIIKSLASGTIVLDENVNTKAIDFAGDYNVVGFGGLSAQGDEFIISFSKNGFGGFESYDPESDITSNVVWSWEPTKSGMKATRYMLLSPEGDILGLAESEDDVQACENGEISCHPYQKREYKLIAKDGNKFTMLRRMEIDHRPNDSDVMTSVNYSINYLYKK